MNFPSSWIAALPSASACANAARHALRKRNLRIARREHAVHHRDLVGMDAHLALEAVCQCRARRRFQPLRIGQINPHRIQRRIDARTRVTP